MTIDLAPIYARLAWAAVDAERVRQLCGAWAADAIQTSTTLDADQGVRVYRAEVVGDPPMDIALALGDCLHQARATLDNLVGVLRGRATRNSAFRFDTDPLTHDLDPWRDGSLKGVPPWALAVIRWFQPFPGNERRWIGEGLADLHHLAIGDRHQALLLSAALIDLNRTHFDTSHPESTHFNLPRPGRVLTATYPAEAQVRVHTGVDVIVREPRIAWRDGHYPEFPTAQEVAEHALWGVTQVVDAIRWADPG